MNAAVSPAKEGRAFVLESLVFGVIEAAYRIDFSGIHRRLGDRYQLQEMRDSLDALSRQRLIVSMPGEHGSMLYQPARKKRDKAPAKQLPAAAEPRAPVAAPATREPIAPPPPRPAAGVPLGSLVVLRDGSAGCLVYKAVLASSKPVSLTSLHKDVRASRSGISVALSVLTSRGVLVYRRRAGSKCGTYALAASPPQVRIVDTKATIVTGIARLQEKQDLLRRLKALVTPQDAEILGAISQDLTGVAA